MKHDEVLSNDPWQKLARSNQMKKVSLAEALEKLRVSEEEVPQVKRQMLSQVTKLARPARKDK